MSELDWQPIETAPRIDMEPLFGWADGWDLPMKIFWDEGFWFDGAFYEEAAPTHWVPWPKPPITPGSGSKTE